MPNIIVKDVKVTSEGSFIYFLSGESIAIKTNVSITLDERELSFEVDEVSTIDAPIRNGNKMILVRAVQVGYYNRNLNRNKNLDIRDITGLAITIITDDEKKKEIAKESRWC